MEKNIVSKKSVNGGSQVSGGFIFDQMDRFAHDCVIKEENIKGYLFTEEAKIKYHKQICDWDDVKLKLFFLYNFGKLIEVIVLAVDKKRKFVYSEGKFYFREKDHTFCDKKGE